MLIYYYNPNLLILILEFEGILDLIPAMSDSGAHHINVLSYDYYLKYFHHIDLRKTKAAQDYQGNNIPVMGELTVTIEQCYSFMNEIPLGNISLSSFSLSLSMLMIILFEIGMQHVHHIIISIVYWYVYRYQLFINTIFSR